MQLAEAQALMSGFDIPTYKQDLSRDCNILWLLEHLCVRNLGHRHFLAVQGALLDAAAARNLLKRKALADYRQRLARWQLGAGTHSGRVSSASEHQSSAVPKRSHTELRVLEGPGVRLGEMVVVGSRTGSVKRFGGNP